MKESPFNLVQGVSMTKIDPLGEGCEHAICCVSLRVIGVKAARSWCTLPWALTLTGRRVRRIIQSTSWRWAILEKSEEQKAVEEDDDEQNDIGGHY